MDPAPAPLCHIPPAIHISAPRCTEGLKDKAIDQAPLLIKNPLRPSHNRVFSKSKALSPTAITFKRNVISLPLLAETTKIKYQFCLTFQRHFQGAIP